MRYLFGTVLLLIALTPVISQHGYPVISLGIAVVTAALEAKLKLL